MTEQPKRAKYARQYAPQFCKSCGGRIYQVSTPGAVAYYRCDNDHCELEGKSQPVARTLLPDTDRPLRQ